MTKKISKKVRPVQPRHIPACIKEALAMHEALRRLGFSAESIFTSYHETQVSTLLMAQGRVAFVISCGEPGMSKETFAELWRRACCLWNGTEPGMTGTTREIIYENSQIVKYGLLPMVSALQAKGIEVPIMTNLERLAGAPSGSMVLTDLSAELGQINSKGGQA